MGGGTEPFRALPALTTAALPTGDVRKNEDTGSAVSLILDANGDVSLRLIVPARKPADVGQDGCSDCDLNTTSEGNP